MPGAESTSGSSPAPSPIFDPALTVRIALDRSRTAMARISDLFRVVVVAAFWLLHFLAGPVFGLDNWRGNLDIWSIYLVIALGLLLITPRLTRLAPRSVRLVPFLDMPMLFLLTDRLAPLGDDPSAVVGFAAGGFVLLILWSAMALEPKLTMLGAAIAGGLQATLFHRIGSDPAGLAASFLLMISAGSLTVFVSGRLGAAMAGLTEARVRREEAERSMDDKDRFVSTVSHDFRSPLAVILASLQTLEASPDLPEAQRRGFIEGAIRQCRRMMSMSEDLLRLARLSGQGPVRSTLDLSALIERATRALEPRAAGMGVHLEVSLPSEPTELEAEPELIERALINLVDNALRFAPDGTAVRVGLTRVGSELVIQVDDEGPGIDPEERERVFEPFYQVEEGRARGGTGLGLAIVREVARAHGGRAAASEAPSGGARITIHLPTPSVG